MPQSSSSKVDILRVLIDAQEAKMRETVCRIDKRFDHVEETIGKMQSDIRSIQLELAMLIARLGVLKYLGGLCLGGIVTLIVRSFY